MIAALRRLAVAVAVTIQLFAATTRPAAAADPALLDEARALIRQSGATDASKQMLVLMMDQLQQMIAALNPDQGPAVAALLNDHLWPELLARLPEMETAMAELYARHFTAEEIAEMSAFYDTPTGRKLVQTLPTLLQEAQKIGQEWGQRVATESLRKLEPLFEERGLKAPNI